MRFIPATVRCFTMQWETVEDTVPPTYHLCDVSAGIHAVNLNGTGGEEISASFYVNLTPEEKEMLRAVWESVLKRLGGTVSQLKTHYT